MSEEQDRPVEWRICWSASSNASFQGASDWEPGNPDESGDAIEANLELGEGLELALEFSGFGWWVETR